MYNFELDQSLLPKAYISWDTTKGTQYLDCEAGAKTNEPYIWHGHHITYRYYNHDKNTVVFRGHGKQYWQYLKYHEDEKLLELAQVVISTSRKEVARKWEYVGERYFLSKDKTVRNINGEIQTRRFVLDEGQTFTRFKDFLRCLLKSHGYKYSISEFVKLIGSDFYSCGSGRSNAVKYSWHIIDWYVSNTPKKPATKPQKAIDEITQIQLPHYDSEPIEDTRNPRYQSKYHKIARFELVNDNWFVIRHFVLNKDDKYEETNRTYFDNSDKIMFAVKTDNGWVSCRQIKSEWEATYIVNLDEAVAQCKRIKYIVAAVPKDKMAKLNAETLITAMRFPEIEQLIKFGCANTAFDIAKNTYTKAELKHTFGGYYNEKEKTFLKKIGMTKKQFDYCMRKMGGLRCSFSSILKYMREICGNDLSHMDQASFEKYYAGCTFIASNFSVGYRSRYNYYVEMCEVEPARFFKNLIRIGSKDNRAYVLARDAMRQYTYLNAEDRPEINWYFDSVSDITRVHDSLVELYNAQQAAQRTWYHMQAAERQKKDQEKMEKLDEKRKAWEYEDDQFIIRLPKSISEIVTEGSKQRICIGSYASSHANGHTNLFFIRKKADADSPFYAIEMDNSKHIRQIHGFGNRWLGCNPEAIPTVVRWMRKNDIKCDNKILTCTSIGYRGTCTCIPMPKVD